MRIFRPRRRTQPEAQGPHTHRVVRLHGALDGRSAEATGRRLVRLANAGPEVLEVDLADVKYLSPDGCAALFLALRAARAHGTRLTITHADERARSVLLQIGLSRALSAGTRDDR
ncbi:STAS domain-containing protein [Streptomyces sp. AC550_RSS872]|uniref:STAS domain-containing protein n=1 Tax=Streptomyces sp. AC550_RSS872 TaxID=2823689 RepID=UPI001C259DC4|nr:STAS domain-containing protein [Streptomyces sp. AC550_RSS872]